ncbi:MAG: hypothetical protein RIC03_06815 [Cyclobacteriaceae bacterium]
MSEDKKEVVWDLKDYTRPPQKPKRRFPFTPVQWAAEAGFTKLPEQVELVQQQAFENGQAELVLDIMRGLYKHEGIWNWWQVKAELAKHGIDFPTELIPNNLK